MDLLPGAETLIAETLIAVAAVDDRYAHNIPTYQGGDVVVMSTAGGGYTNTAFIGAYEQYPQYESYLFIHDSMRGIEEDVVAPFRAVGAPVVAWGLFPMCWDSPEQYRWVAHQYPPTIAPAWGIFGPTFYATREAMEQAEPYFPATPRNRIEFQGTERAWAYCFATAGVEVGAIGPWNNTRMEQGPYPAFRKEFANRA